MIFIRKVSRNLTKEDFLCEKMKCAIKLLAISKRWATATVLWSARPLVRKEHPLYMVNDVFNAVCVEGNMLEHPCFMEVEQESFRLPVR